MANSQSGQAPQGPTTVPDNQRLIRQKLDQLKKELCRDRTLATGANEAARTTLVSAKDTRDFKVCIHLKAQETLGFYRGLDYYLANPAGSQGELLNKNVNALVAKSAALETALKDLGKTIKLTKEKVYEMKAAACALGTALDDSCNADQKGILGMRISGFESDVRRDIIKASERAAKLADRTFNSTIEVTGIQAFSEVTPLQQFATTTVTNLKNLKTDVDGNLKTRGTEAASALDELSKYLKDVAEAQSSKYGKKVALEGVAFTIDFICEPENPGGDICDISQEARENLCNPSESSSAHSHGHGHGHEHQKPAVHKPGQQRPSQQAQQPPSQEADDYSH